MLNLKIKTLILTMSIILSFSSFSQTEEGTTIVTQDFETWSKLGFKYIAHEKFTIGLNQGFRFNENSSTLDQSLTNLGFKLKATEHLNFGLGLRYISDRGGNDLFDNDFRFNMDIIFKHKVKALKFQYRFRYQNRNEIGLSTEEGDSYKHYLRLKAGVKYSIKNWKLDPIFSTEIFRDMTKVTGGFDKLRFTLGTTYDFKKFGELGLYYRLERELGFSYPKTTSIVGLNYTYTFKKRN
jgi:hypothetical protein